MKFLLILTFLLNSKMLNLLFYLILDVLILDVLSYNRCTEFKIHLIRLIVGEKENFKYAFIHHGKMKTINYIRILRYFAWKQWLKNYVCLRKLQNNRRISGACSIFLEWRFVPQIYSEWKMKIRGISTHASCIRVRERVDIKSASNLNIATCRGDLRLKFKSPWRIPRYDACRDTSDWPQSGANACEKVHARYYANK